MAKPNYKYDKRQRDLAKKKKQDEKRLRKLEKGRAAGTDAAVDTTPDVPKSDPAGEANS
ncbi:MAG: hypothetical protein KGI64_10690 [Xanthomonadaceae bacterium]|nr:hypothetical protein [Xanthomonadaceae bacterium]MDE2258067.1 hypothetical protein [Xanthomonadaceae bacterium]